MTIFYLLLMSIGLLFVPLELTALQMVDLGSWKFIANIFTHQLAHGGIRHLIGNYMFMIPYAIFLEYKLGRKNFLVFYFACGFLAALSQILGTMPVGMVGSSGAAYGVFAGACALFDRSVWQRLIGFSLLGIACMNQFLAANSLMALFSGVAYWAHFGGAVGGLALIHFFVKPELQSQSKSERKPTSRAS